jgi:hypothetical protein
MDLPHASRSPIHALRKIVKAGNHGEHDAHGETRQRPAFRRARRGSGMVSMSLA